MSHQCLHDALAMIEFLQSIETEEGAVYRWQGTFRNYEFDGTVRRLQLV